MTFSGNREDITSWRSFIIIGWEICRWTSCHDCYTPKCVFRWNARPVINRWIACGVGVELEDMEFKRYEKYFDMCHMVHIQNDDT